MAHILIAEDDPHFREFLQVALTEEGHSVLVASDGEEALAQFETHPIDLALLDIRMPKLGGFEVCKTIRATSDIPIVMLTALSNSEYVEQALSEFGADMYILKTVTPEEIFVRIEAMLRRVDWQKNPR